MVLKMAVEARAIGDPYGTITMGMLRGARRESDVYDRIRERLADLRDSHLRIRLHTLMLTLTMSLEGMLEMTQRIEARVPTGMTVDEARLRRDETFDFIAETIPEFDSVLARLSKVARVSFDEHEAVVRS